VRLKILKPGDEIRDFMVVVTRLRTLRFGRTLDNSIKEDKQNGLSVLICAPQFGGTLCAVIRGTHGLVSGMT
jgi:hypothetical protein